MRARSIEMTYATLNGVVQHETRPNFGGAKTVWAVWRNAVRGRADWALLLILFIALQLIDITTTNYGLAIPGNWEGNPLMAFLQAHLGGFWWVPKIAGVFLVCLAVPLLRRRWLMVYAVAYCALTVSGNLAVLGSNIG